MTELRGKKTTDYSGVIIGAVLLPVIFFFIYLGKEDMGRSVCIVLAAILLAIRIRWDLRKHFWFWGVIGVVFALHIPLFLFLLAAWMDSGRCHTADCPHGLPHHTWSHSPY